MGCDWSQLGVGARSAEGQLRYCCSNDAIDLGLCAGTQYGRLIMNGTEYPGKHRLINIPATGELSTHLKYGRFEETKQSGQFVVVFANCNDEGRPVIVEGRMIWKSLHGYLPGDMFGLMYFYAVLFLVYFVILLWYGITMKVYEDANIPIQSWIFGTICVGTLEVFFRSGDLFVWNEDGTRFWVALYVGECASDVCSVAGGGLVGSAINVFLTGPSGIGSDGQVLSSAHLSVVFRVV
jgi:Lung seven transmembrane receptor